MDWLKPLHIIQILFWIAITEARIGFKKDQSEYAAFPPKVGRTPDGIPAGHLRPLGWQRSPEGPIKEQQSLPKPEAFYKRYVQKASPVVFRGAVKDVPATVMWDDAYLKEQYGDLNVHATVKKELASTKRIKKKMKLRKFLKEYQYEDWYLTNIVPQEMMHELVVPDCLECGMRSQLLESELWMSSGGTASRLHSHADHNLHCVLAGRKDFIIMDPKMAKHVYYMHSTIEPGAGHADIDVDMVNAFENEKVQFAKWSWSTLRAGDCIYVPASWLHQVRSYGRSISWTTLWAPVPRVSFADCDDDDSDALSLSEAGFMWSYHNADKQLTSARLNVPRLQHHLEILMRDEESLRYQVFNQFYMEVMSEIKDFENVKDVWSLMDTENKTSIPRKAVRSLSTEILEKVAKALNKPSEHVHTHDEL